MRVDSFGNLITNFRQEDFSEDAQEAGKVQLRIGNHPVSRLVETFALGNSGEAVAYIRVERVRRNRGE